MRRRRDLFPYLIGTELILHIIYQLKKQIKLKHFVTS